MATKREVVVESPETYRRMLLEKRSQVLSGLGSKFDTLARMGRMAEDDQAQLSHDEFVSLHLNSLDYAQLRLVDEALDRLDSGDYGICLCCEDPIPSKRLRALSWARYCVKCQENVGAQREMEPGAWSRPGRQSKDGARASEISHGARDCLKCQENMGLRGK